MINNTPLLEKLQIASTIAPVGVRTMILTISSFAPAICICVWFSAIKTPLILCVAVGTIFPPSPMTAYPLGKRGTATNTSGAHGFTFLGINLIWSPLDTKNVNFGRLISNKRWGPWFSIISFNFKI